MYEYEFLIKHFIRINIQMKDTRIYLLKWYHYPILQTVFYLFRDNLRQSMQLKTKSMKL